MTRETVERPSRQTAIAAWAGAGALIGLIWAAAGSFIAFDRNETIEAALRENQNRAIAFEQYVTRTLETADLAAEHLALGMAGSLAAPAVGERPLPLRDPIADNPLFGAVIVTDAGGHARYSNIAGALPLDLSASHGLRRMRESGFNGPLISRPRLSRIVDRPLFSVTRAVRDGSGRLRGTVIVQIPVEQLIAFSEGATIRALDLISVIRLDGVTLARRTGDRISYGENLSGKLVMEHQLRDPNGSYLGPSALDGIPRYFSHRRLKRFPVFVTVGIGESDVLAPVREHRSWAIIAAAALSAAIAALALVITSGARRRQRAADALREANCRFEAAQRVARIGDWTFDPGTRTISLSPALCEMYGRAAERSRLPLEQWLAYFDEADRGRMTDAIATALATGEPQTCECHARTGPEISVRRIALTPLQTRGGETGMLSGTDQDISQERLNARLRDEVAHRGRVQSMNLMAATIAHELAQPLTAASNYLMVSRLSLQSQPPATGNAEEALDKAELQLGVAKEIMRGASDMLSRRRNKAESAPVAAIVEDSVHLVKLANRLGPVAIDVAPIGEEMRVAANKVQVQQVLMNLLRNAVAAAGAAEHPRVTVRAKAEAATILLCVEDNGPGFPAGAEDLFEPFAAEESGGLGLGLSISRTIVESYGGSIWIERDGGTCVWLRLPGALAGADSLERQGSRS